LIECVTKVHEYWGNYAGNSYLARGNSHLLGHNRHAIVKANVNETSDGFYDASYEVIASHGEVVALNKRKRTRFKNRFNALIDTLERAQVVAYSLGAEVVTFEGVDIGEYIARLREMEERSWREEMETNEAARNKNA
jgi:hypothetical protein